MARSRITHIEYRQRCLRQGHGMHAKPGYVNTFNKRGYHVQNKPVNKSKHVLSSNVQSPTQTEVKSFEEALAIEIAKKSKLLKMVLR